MAMLKSIMIDTLRESTENDAVWELRRAFLNQNWNVHADTPIKDYIIKLSQCFVKMALQNDYNYPHYEIQEVYRRSWGLRDDITKAQYKMASSTASSSSSGPSVDTTQTSSADSTSVNTNALSVIPARKSKRERLNDSSKGLRKPRYANAPSLASFFVKGETHIDNNNKKSEHDAAVESWRVPPAPSDESVSVNATTNRTPVKSNGNTTPGYMARTKEEMKQNEAFVSNYSSIAQGFYQDIYSSYSTTNHPDNNIVDKTTKSSSHTSSILCCDKGKISAEKSVRNATLNKPTSTSSSSSSSSSRTRSISASTSKSLPTQDKASIDENETGNDVPSTQDAARYSLGDVKRQFDSYFAWRDETDDSLKKIRRLGHMYRTLPHAGNHQSAILKCLISTSGIEIKLNQTVAIPDQGLSTYHLVMDREIVLAACTADSEEQAYSLISAEFFNKVSKKYLCLNCKTLLASFDPFPVLTTDEMESKNIIYDVFQREVTNKTNHSNPPHRFKNFYLVENINQLPYGVVVNSAKLLGRRFQTKSVPAKPYTIFVIRMDGTVIGTAQHKTNKTSKRLAGELTYKELRRCHWLIKEKRLPKNHKRITGDVLAECLPKTSHKVEAIADSNIGHKMLSKMGWTGGGVGKTESGIVEPITVQILSKKAGLGFQNVPCASSNSVINTGNISSVTNMGFEEMIKCYADSPTHRELVISRVSQEDINAIQIYSRRNNMDCKIRGRRIKRMVLTKKLDGMKLMSTLIGLGGRSDKFDLIPPQQFDMDTKKIGPIAMKLLNKCNKVVQCNLINACALTTFEKGPQTRIVHDVVKCSDSEEYSDEGSDNDDNEDVVIGNRGFKNETCASIKQKKRKRNRITYNSIVKKMKYINNKKGFN